MEIEVIIGLVVAMLAIIIAVKIAIVVSKLIFKLILIGITILILAGLLYFFFVVGDAKNSEALSPSFIGLKIN